MFPQDLAKNLAEGPKKKIEAPWKPEKEPTGFFPPAPPSQAKKSVIEKETTMSMKRTSTQPLLPAEQLTQPATPATPIRSVK